MRRYWKRGAAILCVILLFAGVADALLIFGTGTVAVPEVSPGAGPFNTILTINTTPFAAGGYGDVIYGIEEGRDERGPFAALVWAPGLQGSPHGPAGPFGPHITTFGMPPFNYQFLQAGLGYPPWGPGGGGFPNIRLVYRPTNDPINPGWNSIPGSAGQIENAQAAAHAVAEAFRGYVAAQAAGTYPLFVLPMIVVEIDPNINSPTHQEFYKFRIVTR